MNELIRAYERLKATCLSRRERCIFEAGHHARQHEIDALTTQVAALTEYIHGHANQLHEKKSITA